MSIRLAAGAVLLCGAAMLPGCGSFRTFWTGLKNDSLEGKAAPPLTSTTWITPDGARSDAAPEAEWWLLAFSVPN